MSCTLINGNCFDELKKIDYYDDMCIVTDPPYNIGFNYNSFKDNLPQEVYLEQLSTLIENFPTVIINYPETICELSAFSGYAPNEIVTWVYNSQFPRQSRAIAFFNVEVDFNKLIQPYKNPNDKRIKKLIESGKKGCASYDWWEIQQVKNVSKEKTEHPCPVPLKLMENILTILSDEYSTIIDPFMGGTTGVACLQTNRNFIGIELDEKYYEIAKERCSEYQSKLW